MRGPRWTIGLVGAAIAAEAGAASADRPPRSAAAPPTEAIALRYQAPPGCPDRAAYVDRVAAHGGGLDVIERAREGGAAPTRLFAVRVDRRGPAFLGAVTIVAGRDRSRRTIDGADCAALVDALALVTVLALEPGATVDGFEPVADARPVPDARRRLRLALGTGATGALGVGPDPLPSVPLFVEVEGGRGRVRLSARWGRRAAAIGMATATFAWTRAQLEVCPRGATLARGPIAAGACAGFAAGALRGEGAAIDGAQASTRPWLAPTAAGFVRGRRGRWFAELDAGAAVPLIRDRFFFAPDTTVHAVPAVVGELAVVGGVWFR